MRAILALWVVLVHVSKAVFDVNDLPLSGIIYDEKTRVKVFFMISGMVVFGMLKAKNMDFWPYITGRVRRIYPAYLAAIILSLLTIPVSGYALRTIPFDVPQNVARLKILASTIEFLPAHILAHISMLHGVVPTNLLPYASTSIIGQAWNISTEFQFYLVAPALVLLSRQSSRRVVIGLAALLVIVVLGLWYPNPATLARAAGYFAIGIASYYILTRSDSIFKPGRQSSLAMALIALFAIAFIFIDWSVTLWIGFLAATAPYHIGATQKRPLAVLASKPMLFMGSLSYSLYLSHMIAMYPSIILLNSFDMPRPVYFIALLALTVFGATMLAWVLHKFVEIPFGRRGQADKVVLTPSAQSAS